MKKVYYSLIILCIGLNAFGILSSHAATIYVDSAATGSNNGTSWTDAYNFLQTALANASAGDEVWVAQGTYKPSITDNRTEYFVIPNAVAVYGGFVGGESSVDERDYLANTTILSGDIGTPGDSTDNSYHVVFFNTVNDRTILDGFVITSGKSGEYSEETSFSDTIVGAGIVNIVTSNGQTSNPVIANCTFMNNSAFLGGGFCDFTASGTTNATISNCTFSNNFAFLGGGVSNFVFNNGLCASVIDTCTFKDNIAGQGGGGISNMSMGGEANLEVNYCTFKNNAVDTASDGGEGGAMINNASMSFDGTQTGSTNPVLTHCTFIDNVAPAGGGMGNYIDLGCNNNNIVLDNCTFERNKAIADGDGGGFSLGCDSLGSATVAMSNCTFRYDSAYSKTGDWATGGGMRLYTNGGGEINIELDSCTFDSNYAVNAGGGFSASCDNNALINIDMAYCTFNGNVSEQEGGGVSTASSGNGQNNLTASNCTFKGNRSNERGGGVVSTCYNAVIMPVYDQCTFNNNTSKYQGAGLYNACWGKGAGEEGENMPQITNCSFENNTSDSSGGAGIYNYYSDPYLYKTDFINNIAYSEGGGLSNNNSNPVIDSCNIKNNRAVTMHAGGINNYQSNPMVKNTVISGNACAMSGGGVFSNSSKATFLNCQIAKNKAMSGGGVSIFASSGDTAHTILENCMIFNNSANDDGGGIKNYGDSAGVCLSTIINCIIYGDSAETGAAIHNASFNGICEAVVTNTSISGNFASQSGGGLFNIRFGATNNPVVTVNNSIIFGNSTKGGQIFNQNANTSFAYSDIEGSGGSTAWNSSMGADSSGNIDVDPLFVNMPDTANAPNTTADLVLQNTSPCIDTGTIDTSGLNLPETDLTGFKARIINGRIDMGAYEVGDSPPILTTKDVTVMLDNNGEASITKNDVVLSASDDGMLADTTISQSLFNCSDIGAVNIDVSVTDTAGNITTKEATVTVQDTILPTISCPSNQTVDADSTHTYTVSGTSYDPVNTDDNCNFTVANDFNDSATLDGAELPEGTNTISWVITDDAGNKDTCTLDIEVNAFVSVEDIKATALEVYPNPTDGKVVIQLREGMKNGTIECLDITGAKILTKAVTKSKTEINLSPYSSGIYFLRIIAGKQVVTRKISKQ